MQVLLGHATLSHLPPATAHYLTGRTFFPHLISDPFAKGLTEAFAFAAGVCVLGAVASLLRGGKYHHTELSDQSALPLSEDRVGAQEAIAETEPILVD